MVGSASNSVRSGLEVLLADEPIDLADARIGLLSHQGAIDDRYRATPDLLAAKYPGQLVALFSPQHGFWGEQQANMIESAHETHPLLGVPIYSLYSETRQPTAEMLVGIDVLLVDLQDVGTRVYTFVWTLLNCLRTCARAGIEVVVLDRPNPIDGLSVEGAVLQEGYRSIVGEACIPMRHGLTMGELAGYLNTQLQIGARVRCVPLQNWRRSMYHADTGLPWVPPSPNLPTADSAIVYPGQVLLEGTNLSEGRGTTTPFEVTGAPYIDPFKLADRLTESDLSGVVFRPLRFRPTFDKWTGEVCGGVALHVTDPAIFRPYRTTLQLLSTVRELCPDDFAWTPPPYEYEENLMPIDILSGDDRLRTWLDDQGRLTEDQFDALCENGVSDWLQTAREFRLYPAD